MGNTSQKSAQNKGTRILYDPEDRHKVVFGMIRAYNKYDLQIPKAIKRLCLQYYDDIIDWIIKDDELKTFYNKQNTFEPTLNGPSFMINNIPLLLSISPDGSGWIPKGFVAYFFGCDCSKLPINVDNVTVLMILFCRETNYVFRHSKTFYCGNKMDYIVWYYLNMRLKDARQANYKSIHFGCYVDLLHINYKKDKKQHMKLLPCYFTQDICMWSNYKYIWRLNKEEINRFKTGKYGQSIYSPMINNNCWCIVCSPNGITKKTKNNIHGRLKILKLPYGIQSIVVQYTLVLKVNGKIKIDFGVCTGEKRKTYSYKQNGTELNSKVKLSKFVSLLANKRKVSIHLSIMIMSVYDNEGESIDKKQWNDVLRDIGSISE
eukprot:108531_1